MAQQNKRPGPSRRSKLEKELMGDIAGENDFVEVGRNRVQEYGPAWKNRALATTRTFHITQGRRRRHPDRVLHQYAGVAGTTDHAHTAWERALLESDKRVEIEEAYIPEGDMDSIASQLGTVQAAAANFKVSNFKLSNIDVLGG